MLKEDIRKLKTEDVKFFEIPVKVQEAPESNSDALLEEIDK